MADREPIGGPDRPSGEMSDPRPAQGAAHAGHDPFVLAAAADRDANTMTRLAAERQVRACDECAALFADLQALSAGLSSLPRELPAPRDFRLTPEKAASLRRRSWRAAFDGLFRSPSLRPFGTALATLGFAGLFLTVAMPAVVGGLGSAASAPALTQTTGGAGAGAPELGPAANPASSPGAGGGAGGSKAGATPPADNSGGTTAVQPSGQPPSAQNAYGAQTPVPTDVIVRDQARGPYQSVSPTPPTPAPFDVAAFLPWLSLGAFVVGLGLLLLARFGGRARAG